MKKPIKYYRPMNPTYFDVGRSTVVFTLYTEEEKQQRILNGLEPRDGRYQITSTLTKRNQKTGEFWTLNSHYIPKEPQ